MKNKFRAWFKHDIESGEPLLFEEREVEHKLYFVCTKDSDIKYELFVPFISDDWIVEKNIGVSDIDGTDIFEGDILFDDFNNEIGYVVWNEDNLRYEICFYDNSYEPLDKNYANSLKIIGNLHENYVNAKEKKEIKTDKTKKYTILVEGNITRAEPMIKMYVEMFGADNVKIEYNGFNLACSSTSIDWFSVKCVEQNYEGVIHVK